MTPYFASRYLVDQMDLRNVKFAPTGVPTIGEMVGMAAQAVGDGVCSNCLVIYPTGNLEGRYRRGGENADDWDQAAARMVVSGDLDGGTGIADAPLRAVGHEGLAAVVSEVDLFLRLCPATTVEPVVSPGANVSRWK